MGASRFMRQSALVPHEKLDEFHPVVIGVGAIGRQVAIQLAAIGAKHVTLYDHDTVEEVNCAVQGYHLADVGRYKVNACKDHMMPLGCEPQWHHERFVPRKFSEVLAEQPSLKPVFFFCVDSIDVRKALFEEWRSRGLPLIIDGRMLGEAMQCLTAIPETADRYASTLFAAEEAVPEACGAKSTIYTGAIVAGLMVHQFCRYLRGIELTPHLSLALVCDELEVLKEGAVDENSWEEEADNAVAQAAE